jgi:PAS domain S-box-containing protein
LKHDLSNLESLIQTNFVVVSDCNQPSFEMRSSPAFYNKSGDWFVRCSGRQQAKTKAVSLHRPFSEIIHLLKQNDFILIEDDEEKPIGYLHAPCVLQAVFQSYQVLEAYFTTMLQTVDTSITVIDAEQRTAVWTAGAEQIFSIQAERIIGNPITDFFDPEKLQILETLKTGRSVYRQQHQPQPDLFVMINTNPVLLDGEIIGAVSTDRDMTSEVRLNQELFAASSKVHDLQQEMDRFTSNHDPFQRIKGNSPAVRQTIEMIKKVGSTKATVLILGESGVGKELFARAIHDVSQSPDDPFIEINCGAITPSLFESELFGYEKGAFTGADHKGKKGKIALSDGGTLFLDEVAEIPLDMQVKLLRVLQEKRYYPVGGTKQVDVDFRVISATNRDLAAMVKEGKFREDLFYRLNVISLPIPPLRERKEDIIELTHYFLYQFSVRHKRQIHGISHTIMQDLLRYEWPGNIRELGNVIERLVIFATDGRIERADLPFLTQNEMNKEPTTSPAFPQNEPLPLQQELDRYEKKVILHVLERERGNKMETAKALGISRATLYNKMNKMNIPL